ncbi:MAG: hypothetical protein WD207_12135, partial [Xanthobacteraceae bacterium]
MGAIDDEAESPASGLALVNMVFAAAKGRGPRRNFPAHPVLMPAWRAYPLLPLDCRKTCAIYCPRETSPLRMKSAPATKPTLSRRRLLALAGASLAFPASAFAQSPFPFPPLFPPLFPPQKVQPPQPGAELPPGLTAPAKPDARQITQEDWFLESTPDGA